MLLFEVLLTLVFVASTIVPIICHLADGPSETETETKTKTETKRSTDSRHFTPTEYWAFLLRFLKPDQLVEKGAFRLYQMAQYLEINGFLDSNETFSTRAWATLWTAAVTVTYKRPYTVPTSIDDLTDSDLHFCKKKIWQPAESDEEDYADQLDLVKTEESEEDDDSDKSYKAQLDLRETCKSEEDPDSDQDRHSDQECDSDQDCNAQLENFCEKEFWGADDFESLEDFFRLELKEWANQESLWPQCGHSVLIFAVKKQV